MGYKAVFIDMDGTLLNSRNEISEQTVKSLQRLEDNGLKVHLATGRHYGIVEPYHKAIGLKTPVICLNGSYIYDPLTKKEIFAKTFTAEAAGLYKRISDNVRMCSNVLFHTREGLYCEKVDEHVEHWIQTSGVQPYFQGALDDLEQLDILKYGIMAEKRSLTKPWRTRSAGLDVIEWKDGFEVVPKGVSKWKGIRTLLSQYAISPSEVITIGDGPNDVEMIRESGLGIAMKNAVEEVLAVSDMTTTYDHNQEGVMDSLSQVLQEQTV